MLKRSLILPLLIIPLIVGCSNGEVKGKTEESSKIKTESNLPAGLLEADNAPIAPDFSLPNIDGSTTSLSDYKGKVVILDFWDTWCPPCKKEIPGFIELQEKYKDKGLVIIGAAFGRDGKAAVEKFAKNWNINYPIIIADQKVNGDYGGIRSIPTTFVIDTNGKARSKHVGFVEKAVFEREIKALLPK